MRAAQVSWRLEAHVCRVCFARVVSRDDGEARVYQCSNCGLEARAHSAACICACGTKFKKGKNVWADAGIRCHENHARSPEFPALFTASYGGEQAET